MSQHARPRRRPVTARLVALCTLGLVVGACTSIDSIEPQVAVRGETLERPETATTTATTAPPASLGVPQSTVAVVRPELTAWQELSGPYTVEVLETRAHDTGAFTQGLLRLDDGTLVESTGLIGSSVRQRLDADGVATVTVPIADDVFGSAIALSSGLLHQFALEGGDVVLADPVTLDEVGRLPLADPVWGACGIGDQLVTSNGSSTLTIRDTELAPVATLNVTLDGEPVSQLNELACIDGLALANVWLQPGIVAIDLVTGMVVATIDASSLVPGNELGADDVLNGIAIDRDSDTLWLTGKRWDTIYRVALVPAG